ncbi:TonB-dependent receptor [Arenimonas sp.]|uniref:TonB-dependent receptor n=1 Tax=Arenimonas sp. TaxID=1872635 RepID=UPI0039E53205
MNRNYTHNRLRRTGLAVALGLCFASGAQAQSNSTGNISGTTTAGATVVIENEATGFRREITADANGNYRVGNLAIGDYKVTAGGQTKTVNVSIGQTTDIGAVEVVGGGIINAIDVSSVESTTILTAEQIAKVPVARNITNVALLAPGTVRGDAAFGNLASFGGGAVSENGYFVNGFNITNSFRNLNFAQIPFEAIAEQQVKTGGYGAEFGRMTGGVINIVTKRGTNDFHAGGNVFYSPESLNGHNPDVYYNDSRYPGGKRHVSDNSKDTPGSVTTASVWASGALVKDHLFAYALLSYGWVNGADTYGNIFGNINTTLSQRTPTWLLKLDWAINDSHSLELTAFSDKTKQETDVYSNAIASLSVANRGPNNGTASTAGNGWNGTPGGPQDPFPPLTPATTDLPIGTTLQRTGYLGTTFNENGGTSWSLKYTGYLTDNFTLSALYGQGESSRSNYGIAANGLVAEYNGEVGGPVAGCPVLGTTVSITPPSCAFIGTLGSPKAKDEREQFRIDAEWVIGDHLLRFGYDRDDFTSIDGQATEGGSAWQYRTDYRVASAQNPGTVRRRLFQTGAEVQVNSEAFYIEDRWQVTDNFLAYVGLRWDSFENVNNDGETFVEIKRQFGPRLGFSWDINGDGKYKLYGNAGRYSLPLTATVAVRGASASLFLEQFYTFTGVDPVTGAPTGLTQIINTACGCFDRYLNNEYGVSKDPNGIADLDLQPMYQDEYILGFQAQLTDHLSGGVRGIYRELKAAIDDQCDYRPIYAYAAANGLAFNPYNPGFAFCHLYNPGEDATFSIDIDGDGTFETVHLDAATLGPKAKRTYKAVEFFLEGSWDKFFLQGSYTWAKSSGNTEGGVKSDIGQQDTGTTQDFDYPELTIGSMGYLPNDRRHALKLFGNYEFNEEWSVGASLLVQSGRPINCFGFLDGANVSHYANGYFSCNDGQTEPRYIANPNYNPNLPLSSTNPRTIQNPNWHNGGNNGTTIVSRGTRGRTEWQRTLDLNVAYKPKWADGHLTMKMDVFNVFNSHAVTSVIEQGENTAGEPQLDRYKTPTGFQAPRSFRFMVQYDW